MNLEKINKNYSFFSELLIDKLNQCKKSLIIYNRKGGAKWLVCKECQEVYPCQPLTSCPLCKSHNLQLKGYGVQRLNLELKKTLPNKKIVDISKDTKEADDNFDIILGTEYALRHINLNSIDFICLLSIDHQLAIPHYLSSERVYQLITKLKLLNKPLLIQTHVPENIVIRSAFLNNYSQFYKSELFLRKKFHYPPFDNS